jgi:hypothetical protein
MDQVDAVSVGNNNVKRRQSPQIHNRRGQSEEG